MNFFNNSEKDHKMYLACSRNIDDQDDKTTNVCKYKGYVQNMIKENEQVKQRILLLKDNENSHIMLCGGRSAINSSID